MNKWHLYLYLDQMIFSILLPSRSYSNVNSSMQRIVNDIVGALLDRIQHIRANFDTARDSAKHPPHYTSIGFIERHNGFISTMTWNQNLYLN